MLLNYNKNTGWGGLIGDTAKGIKATSYSSPLEKSTTNLLLNTAESFRQTGQLDSTGLSVLKERFADANTEALKFVETVATVPGTLKQGQTITAAWTAQTSKLGAVWSNVTNLGGKAISMFVNGLASAGISAAISVVISGITSLINSYKDMVKELNEATSKYTDSKKELQEYTQEIKKLRGQLDDETSTTEEVEQATSKLYEIQNKLVSTYGGMASGIDLVNGKLETQLGIINEINKKNYQQWQNEVTSNKSSKSAATSMGVKLVASLANPALAVAENAKSIYSFVKNKSDGESWGNAFKNSFGGEGILGIDYGLELVGNQLEEATKKYENFNKTIKATDNQTVNELIDRFEEFSVVGDKIEISGRVDKVADSLENLQVELKNAGIEDEKLNKALSKTANQARDTVNQLGDTYAQDTYGEILQSQELLKLYYQLQTAYENYQAAIKSRDQKEIDKSVDSLRNAITFFETGNIDQKYKDYFESLYPDIQNYISDWKLEVRVIPKIEESDLKYFLKDHSTEEIIAEYNKYLNQGVEYLDPGGYEQFFIQLQEYARIAGLDVNQLILKLNELSQFSYSTNLEKVKNRNAKSKDYNADQYFSGGVKKVGNFDNTVIAPTQKGLSDLFKDNDFIKTTDSLDSALDTWYHNLSTEMQEAFDKLELSDEEIDILLSIQSDFGRDQWLYNMLHDGEKTVKIKADLTTDLVSDLDALEDKMDSLSTAYESAVTNGTYVGASDLQDVNDDFGGIRDDDGNYTAMAAALEKYNDDLTQNVGNTKIAQQSTNELLTSYLDLSGTLDDLIEEGEDYAKQVLENQGVENAEDVVTSRLNKTYKATRANLVKLSEAMNQTTRSGSTFLDVLESGVREGEDFDDVCTGLVDSVKNLVGIYNQETGELEGTWDDIIDADFVNANIEDIIGAFTGVEGSLDNLYEKVAKLNAEKVYVEAGLDGTELETKMNGIQSLLDIANTWTMEPEALLEDSQFMQALQDCWDGSVETANAINAALSTIGMKVEYKTTSKKIKVASIGNTSNGSGHGTTVYGGGNAGKVVGWDYIDVDDFEVVATTTGKGTTGSTAKYGGGSSPSSNSGGSGDSGSDSSDDETFDWIEVAIDRLENNLDKLSETIDDVYDTWQSRNEAISKSIDEVNKEIELQEQGAARYLEEANNVDLAEEWKKKVREGKIDIDTVSDSDLADNIKEYQTWLFFSHHTYYDGMKNII